VSIIPRLVGMVHLLPLPGSPRFTGSISEVVDTAVTDATTLTESGFPAVLVENFGDAPFHAGAVPPETVASMTVAVNAVAESTTAVVGVNVLRNDAVSALAVAAAAGAGFIRVNVLTGTMYTDQGPVVGDAARVARTRHRLCPDVEVWADVMVKHATPPSGSDPALIARDTVVRGLADAVIVSGAGTGEPTDPELGMIVMGAVPDGTRVVIGSGANPENLASLMSFADTVIVGSWLKLDGDADNRVDPARARAMGDAARSLGLI
jgi:uncharacterized protein